MIPALPHRRAAELYGLGVQASGVATQWTSDKHGAVSGAVGRADVRGRSVRLPRAVAGYSTWGRNVGMRPVRSRWPIRTLRWPPAGYPTASGAQACRPALSSPFGATNVSRPPGPTMSPAEPNHGRS